MNLTQTVRWIPAAWSPTVYARLKRELGREPSNAELCAEVKRILFGHSAKPLKHPDKPTE